MRFKTIELGVRPVAFEMIDPNCPVKAGKHLFHWQPSYFMAMGKGRRPGIRVAHGLKRTVTDDSFCLWENGGSLNETRYIDEVMKGNNVCDTASVEELFSMMAIFQQVARLTGLKDSGTDPIDGIRQWRLVSGKYSE
jgi:hypothetical protein